MGHTLKPFMDKASLMSSMVMVQRLFCLATVFAIYSFKT